MSRVDALRHAGATWYEVFKQREARDEIAHLGEGEPLAAVLLRDPDAEQAFALERLVGLGREAAVRVDVGGVFGGDFGIRIICCARNRGSEGIRIHSNGTAVVTAAYKTRKVLCVI
mgnify:CR=1 FL=1